MKERHLTRREQRNLFLKEDRYFRMEFVGTDASFCDYFDLDEFFQESSER